MDDRQLPEPAGKITSIIGKVAMIDPKDFSLRKGEQIFTADQLRAYAEEAVKQEREAILKWALKGKALPADVGELWREGYDGALDDCVSYVLARSGASLVEL